MVLLPAACAANAGIHQVWDEGHAFKAETIVQVDQLLDEINQKFHKDLMIETFASIPEDLRAKYQTEDPDKFFENWSLAEGGQLQLNGMIILIVRDPRHLYIGIGFNTRQKVFTFADRAELLRVIQPVFHQNEFDKGLLAAVQFVRDRMEKNLSETPSPTTRPATQPPAGSDTGATRQSK